MKMMAEENSSDEQAVRDEGEVDTSLHYVPDEETEKSLVSELLDFKKQVEADRSRTENEEKLESVHSDDWPLEKLITSSDFSPEQRKELERAVNDGLPEEYIMTYANPENSVIKMMTFRKQFINTRKGESKS